MASTTGKNRSILAGLVAPVTETPTVERGAPATERLSTRLTGLARVTSGDVKEKTLKLVDPARCRMWSRHNRRYDLLNEASCADLLESLRSQGEQEFPAIVRRVEDDPAFDYERALDYRHAVETFYGGVAQRMAERLEVPKAWLSRFLDLGKLPTDVVEAFGDPRQLKERHARTLKPLLADDASRPKVMAEAKRLSGVQAAAVASGKGLLDPAKVVTLLVKASAAPASAKKPAGKGVMNVTNEAGATLFTLARKGAKRVVLELSLDAEASNADFQAAFARELDRVRPKA
ncbi:MAG: chromosome partitioning protein ParB [Caulobacter vibrioides]|uniref:Chromosome partitioning protein ParB n=1 Tax=Caulobacter vibrioides TaxID=155892 RepID=A0A258CYK5_CAUVI|nr:MAG: chromosome partitioning protein ParB [Caulobacter vibrioides]